MTTVLSEVFSQYDLEIPHDVCSLVDTYLKKKAIIHCEKCKAELLTEFVRKPFIKNVPTYYKLYHGNVFTKDGVLSKNSQRAPNIILEVRKGVLKAEKTPDVVDVCGVCVNNEIKTYHQSSWYKCLYSDQDNKYVYLCSVCFLSSKRKLRRSFAKWKGH